jgi:hypothetical protein
MEMGNATLARSFIYGIFLEYHAILVLSLLVHGGSRWPNCRAISLLSVVIIAAVAISTTEIPLLGGYARVMYTFLRATDSLKARLLVGEGNVGTLICYL